ncbi:unnamed protein product [Candidula unifasciata]|uniref:TIR domain-containing protein n=1 Tax=Candidula unifasciata TaxID=100452 RepID=A0A8S3ZPJ4_9EUPU|nr:unnamed protein product [Candidula unifasciata]
MENYSRFVKLQLLLIAVSGFILITSVQTQPAGVQETNHISSEPYGDDRYVTCQTRCFVEEKHADCSNCNLTHVPKLDTKIQFLDLSENFIEYLGVSLAIYFNLEHLDISKNQLNVLDNYTFFNLSKLIYLNLEHNNLSMDLKFPRFVFSPLFSLRTLKINHNTRDPTLPRLEYPDFALSFLHNLTELYIDGLLDKILGPGFRTMASLKRLTLSGPLHHRCSTVEVRNKTFMNVPQIEFLNLTRCCLDFSHMEVGVFEPLTNLQVLDLSGNEQQCFDNLIPALRSLQHSNVMYLNITGVIRQYMPCVSVSRQFAEVLPRKLVHLVAQSNSIEIIEAGVLEALPKNLKSLDISDNRLTFGMYLTKFSKLENLQVLNLNGGIFSFNLPKMFPTVYAQSCLIKPESFNYEMYSGHAIDYTDSDPLLKLPQNLESVSINFAGWSYSLTEFTIDPNNSLRHLSLRGNNIPRLVGPIRGLAALTTLDLDECNIEWISEKFFDDFPSLEKLNLSSNYIGENSLAEGCKPLFKSLSKLKYLDLSFVNILTISKHVFDGLVSLEKLWMHNNAFYYFDVHINHMKKLNFVDFRFTELSTLNLSTIEAFNNITKGNNYTLIIDFSETPIHCFCVNLFFLEWIVKSNIFRTKLINYKCVFSDVSEKYVDEFDRIYNTLVRQCSSKFEFFITVLAGTVLILLVVVLSIGYRFRWKLRYAYYSVYLNFKINKEKAGELNKYRYDVFTSYVHDDHDFVVGTLIPQLRSRGLKIHVHGLDFIAGEYIASNILEAIKNSRHTLVVLTRELLKSAWCKYELQMANMEQVHTGRPVLVFLLMENLTKKELGTELLYYIQSNTYIQYPNHDHQDDDQHMNMFWKKLASDLQT